MKNGRSNNEIPAMPQFSARLSRFPSGWGEGSNEGEGAAGVEGVEVVEEVAGGEFAFTTGGMVEPDAGQADDQTTEHAQNGQGAVGADPTAILIEGDIEPLMPGFDAPIAAATAQQSLGGPERGIGTGDERPGSAGRIGWAFPDRAAQFPKLPGRDKADLFRRCVLQAQVSLFVAPPVVLAGLGRARRIRRGEKREPTTVRSRFCATTPDWF